MLFFIHVTLLDLFSFFDVPGLRGDEPRYTARPEGDEGNHRVCHPHPQRAVSLRRRRRATIAATEMAPLLRERNLHSLHGFFQRVRPNSARRSVSFHYLQSSLLDLINITADVCVY